MNNTNDGVLTHIPTPKTKKKVNMSPKAVERRKRVIKRLEDQLKSGIKIPKKPLVGTIPINAIEPISLEETDITRIKREIEILKGRIQL